MLRRFNRRGSNNGGGSLYRNVTYSQARGFMIHQIVHYDLGEQEYDE